MTKTISLSELETKAITLLAEKPRLILALDGPCASGKTTLAHMLQQNLGWTVFHMDDFFLRPEQRTKERYTVPGGNVDHERFLDEVLLPMSMGDPVYLRPFDCKTMDFRKTQTVKPCAVTLVEGAYSCHPSLWDFYDLHLFLEIDPEEQNRRILQRNGPKQAEVFRERWIPLEQAYFAAYHLPERCDYLLNSSNTHVPTK